jgi:hypothetical protein
VTWGDIQVPEKIVYHDFHVRYQHGHGPVCIEAFISPFDGMGEPTASTVIGIPRTSLGNGQLASRIVAVHNDEELVE